MASKRKQHTSEPRQWRNRIIGHDEVDAEQLLAHPKNWRIHPQHQQEALAGVLDSVGWVQQVVVNRRTNFVLDGHLRAALAISRGEKVPVVYVDLSEEEESLVLATLDPVSALAVTDQDKLNELLGDIDTANAAIDQMLYALLDEANKTSLKDEPEPESEEAETSTARKLGDKKAQIKPVLYADEVAVFEQAIRMTGERNRGKAIIAICRAFLDGQERQFDVLAEGTTA